MTPMVLPINDANQNRPQHVFDIRQGDIVIGAVVLDRRLDPFAGVADGKQQRRGPERPRRERPKSFWAAGLTFLRRRQFAPG